MSAKVFIRNSIAKEIQSFDKSEKKLISDSLDMLESLGQLGFPIFRKSNIWKFRIENLRVIYKKTSNRFYVLKIIKGFDPLFFK